MAADASPISSASELLGASILAIGFAGMQVFIGGTRLAFALPVYAVLGLAGVLATAISAAAGFNDFADQKRVRLLRGSEAKVYDVRQFRRDPGLDPKLQPGDKIEVPQSFF